MSTTGNITRRDFLRISGQTTLSAAFSLLKTPAIENSDRIGRVNVGMAELKARPDPDSLTVGKVYEDTVVAWLREVVGRRPWRANQRWVETPDGYIWLPYLQPVKNLTNIPLEVLPDTSLGPGIWAEVTVPFLDVYLDNPPARSPWLQNTPRPRIYFSQVLWIDQIQQDQQGQIWYRVNERYGYGDLLWAQASGFRLLSTQDIAPIQSSSEEKKIVVNLTYQTLSCYEGKNEVYFTKVSTGMENDLYGNPTEEWETPIGTHPIWRKLVSVHMTGGTTGGGYDLAGVSWTTLFIGSGVAIHSTFWHNNFGEPMSHGCVNCRPEDARWIFRWTLPAVAYDPGDITVQMPGGTTIEVIRESL